MGLSMRVGSEANTSEWVRQARVDERSVRQSGDCMDCCVHSNARPVPEISAVRSAVVTVWIVTQLARRVGELEQSSCRRANEWKDTQSNENGCWYRLGCQPIV